MTPRDEQRGRRKLLREIKHVDDWQKVFLQSLIKEWGKVGAGKLAYAVKGCFFFMNYVSLKQQLTDGFEIGHFIASLGN